MVVNPVFPGRLRTPLQRKVETPQQRRRMEGMVSDLMMISKAGRRRRRRKREESAGHAARLLRGARSRW
jgi:hypothetical protein